MKYTLKYYWKSQSGLPEEAPRVLTASLPRIGLVIRGQAIGG
jgi:hypothetical protein